MGRVRRLPGRRILTVISNERYLRLDRDHLEVTFDGSTIWAEPIFGHVFPACTGRDTFFGPSIAFIINKPAK